VSIGSEVEASQGSVAIFAVARDKRGGGPLSQQLPIYSSGASPDPPPCPRFIGVHWSSAQLIFNPRPPGFPAESNLIVRNDSLAAG